MICGLRYRPEARLDLKDIYHHVAEANPSAAAAVVRLIHAKAQLFSDSPRIGQAVPDLAADLRRFPVENYLIFYRQVDAGIDTVRVLHTARDIESLFRDDSS
jgi:toxin ParE1/3/4